MLGASLVQLHDSPCSVYVVQKRLAPVHLGEDAQAFTPPKRDSTSRDWSICIEDVAIGRSLPLQMYKCVPRSQASLLAPAT